MKRFLLIGSFILFCVQAQGRVLYVPDEYPKIQSAINDANDWDTVIVSAGRYQENINFLGKAITVQSTDPNDPNVAAGTIIDGNAPADSNFGSVVTFNSGENANSVLSGFTITGGTGSWLLVSWEFQGLRWNRCGGGVVCYNMSGPTISKNVFVDNTAGQGGGVYIYGDPVNPNNPSNPPVHIRPVISDNTFTSNLAIIGHGFDDPDPNDPNIYDHGDGGAIVGFQGCDATITGNLIQGNYAQMYGGGLHLRQWSNGIIENNRVISNGATIGGGIHVTYSSSPRIADNWIEANQGGSGGGIYVYYLSKPDITGNRIRANSATNSIIGVHYSSTAVIKNNLIDQNTKGPAIICTGGSSLICHNTIIENENCGVYCAGFSSPHIENNIIALTHSGYGIKADADANAVIRYNNVWNNGLGNYGPNIGDLTGTAANISTDPHFLNEPDVCGHLNYTSACIDAGDPNFVPTPNEVDYDGDLRVLNSRTDVGADEAKPVWNLTKQSQYATIQAAIDDANDADDILAIQGRYFENINISGKSIELHSVNPTNWNCIDNTIIDGNQTDTAVVTFAGTEDANCVLSGFTLTGANNTGQGGGIAGNGTAATLSFCRIANNTANEGGGICDFDGLIKNCKISSNSSGTGGGGLAGCDNQIYNCFITDNHAGTCGGGLYDCNASIVNNTIAGNCAAITGGGLQGCHNIISNCNVWANTAPNSSDLNDCSQPTYCCLQTTTGGQGNIYVDPQFVDPNNADYHLTIYSDCIDAGDNNSVPAESVFDIDKEVRVFAFDMNRPAVVDIGADEVITSTADFNDDGTVDYWDFMAVVEDWLTSDESSAADLVADGFIDFADYAVFANDWLWQGPWHRTSRESALKFDSSSDGYVWVHTPEGCILNNVFTFTYTAWIYPLSFSQINARIIGKNERAFMTNIGGTLVGYSHGGGTALSHSDVGTLQIGKWQFVMMIYDYYNGDKKIHLYVDGKEAGYQVQIVGTEQRPPLPDWRAEGEWDLVIGTAAWSHGSYIPDVIIDEVAVYDRVLSREEIDYLYNSGFGRPTPLSLNPVGLWHLDEKQGTAVPDSSGNNNHGALQGTSMPVWTDGKFLEY